ncbi:hypothetical protein, partial [Treponema sp. R6D11]
GAPEQECKTWKNREIPRYSGTVGSRRLKLLRSAALHSAIFSVQTALFAPLSSSSKIFTGASQKPRNPPLANRHIHPQNKAPWGKCFWQMYQPY